MPLVIYGLEGGHTHKHTHTTHTYLHENAFKKLGTRQPQTSWLLVYLGTSINSNHILVSTNHYINQHGIENFMHDNYA